MNNLSAKKPYALAFVLLMLLAHALVIGAGAAMLALGHPALLAAELTALAAVEPLLRIAFKLLGPAALVDRMLARPATCA